MVSGEMPAGVLGHTKPRGKPPRTYMYVFSYYASTRVCFLRIFCTKTSPNEKYATTTNSILLYLCTVLPSSDVPPPAHYHPSQSHSHPRAAHLHARSANPWSRPRAPFPKPQCCLPAPPAFSGAKETRWVLRPRPSHPRSWKGPTRAMLRLLTARVTVPTFTCSLGLTLLLEKVSSHHD